MLERYNPILRIVCIALAGLILYQISRLAFQRDAVARSNFEAPIIRAETTNKAPVETNATGVKTNSVSTTNSTNTVSAATNRPPRPSNMSRRSGGAPPSNLPADVQALIDKIKTSQLLGPDIKPPPMALLGIAGKDVFLRGPNGQTGMIREGEELGGAKLIRIGTNRVIVEHEGQQKELMIFSGFGSETLLEKKDKP
ncbi:MAG TPA: hypothetical protein VM680_12940 [Verrucomicrobiae bacterium]|nr:hypothetical protein [Verrucomicrobiae bacterium]